MRPSRSRRLPWRRPSVSGRSTVLLIIAILAFAPWIRGGNRPLPLACLEILALVSCWSVAAHPQFLKHASWPLRAALMIMLITPLIQLLPVPMAIWAGLDGRAFYADALTLAGAAMEESRPLSLLPFATEGAWYALLPPLVVFLSAVGWPSERLMALAKGLMAMAICQATLGILQFLDGLDSVFRLGMEADGQRAATGSYANRNHLAGLLEMALPVALALMAAHARVAVPRVNSAARRLGVRLARLGAGGGHAWVWYGYGAVLLWAGLLVTLSRAGIALGLLGSGLSTLLRLRHRRRPWVLAGALGMIGLWCAALVAIGSLRGPADVGGDVPGEERFALYRSVYRAIVDFFPLGSGLGSFAEVYRRYQPTDLVGFINHAHNDYLEWLLEGGALVLVAMALLVGAYGGQWLRVWRRGPWTDFQFAQAGAGIALALMALHGAVDFNWHIPANAIYFAALAAIFFHRSARRVHEDSRQSAEVANPQPDALPSASLEQSPNPFRD